MTRPGGHLSHISRRCRTDYRYVIKYLERYYVLLNLLATDISIKFYFYDYFKSNDVERSRMKEMNRYKHLCLAFTSSDICVDSRRSITVIDIVPCRPPCKTTIAVCTRVRALLKQRLTSTSHGRMCFARNKNIEHMQLFYVDVPKRLCASLK
jgi:hypothetical protein